ncbi:MAG: DUF445 family protein [Firmicutes bacterium]|nr:DUF445 family protein [Bacillota bacterium]
MLIQAIAIPILSALIGWITNVIAIRSLFYPRRPFRFPLIGLEIQGLLPKRREDLARDVGRVIEEELLPLDKLFGYLHTPEVQNRVTDSASEMVKTRIRENTPAMVPESLVRLVEAAVIRTIKKETPALFEKILQQLTDSLKEEINVAGVVEEQFRQYELEDLEKLITRVANSELRQIEWLGAVIGFIIGLVQVLIVYLIPHGV